MAVPHILAGSASGTTAQLDANFSYLSTRVDSITVIGSAMGIGTAAPVANLHVAASGGAASGSLSLCGTNGASGNASYILMGNSNGGGAAGPAMIVGANRELRFGVGTDYTDPSGGTFTASMTLTASGTMLIGKSSSSGGTAGAEIGSALGEVLLTRAGRPLWLNRLSSDGAIVDFTRDASGVGSISVTTTATAYNTSSDYRLKTNPQPLTGSGAFIDALQPKTWQWLADGTAGVGFLAHEVALVAPKSVTGAKDAIDSDGQPVYQAMEYGSAEFISNIIAELQSLRARVAALEA